MANEEIKAVNSEETANQTTAEQVVEQKEELPTIKLESIEEATATNEPAPAQEVKPAPQPAPQFAPATKTVAPAIFCPTCGRKNVNNDTFCFRCGTKLSSAPANARARNVTAPTTNAVQYANSNYAPVASSKSSKLATAFSTISFIFAMLMLVACYGILAYYYYEYITTFGFDFTFNMNSPQFHQYLALGELCSSYSKLIAILSVIPFVLSIPSLIISGVKSKRGYNCGKAKALAILALVFSIVTISSCIGLSFLYTYYNIIYY